MTCTAQLPLFFTANARISLLNTKLPISTNHMLFVVNHLQENPKFSVPNVRRNVPAKCCGYRTNIFTRPASSAKRAINRWQLEDFSPRTMPTTAQSIIRNYSARSVLRASNMSKAKWCPPWEIRTIRSVSRAAAASSRSNRAARCVKRQSSNQYQCGF